MHAALSPTRRTTYAYELRELEHEFASISPELARQGGGWRLLIIQEFCDGGWVSEGEPKRVTTERRGLRP